MIPNWRPDWRDPKAYPKANDTSLKQWAWEFLRRNPIYQADFYELEGRLPKVLVPESMEEYFWITSENAHEFDEAYWRDYFLTHIEDEGGAPLSQRLGKKYGVELMCDPAVDKPAVGRLTFKTQWSPTYRINYGPERLSHHPDSECPEIIDYGMLPEEVGEVVVKLDLEWPVETQLERLRRPLFDAQHELQQDGLVVHETRPKVRMYTNYLRLLDGESAGAKTNDMADVLFPGLSNEHPERKRYTAAWNGLKAAKRLRDGNYLFLLT